MRISYAMKVKIKEGQLELINEWLPKNEDLKGTKYYEMLSEMKEAFENGDIDRWREMAKLEEVISERKKSGQRAPMMVGYGGSGETMEQLIEKYEFNELIDPDGVPLRREMIELYKRVYQEELERE